MAHVTLKVRVWLAIAVAALAVGCGSTGAGADHGTAGNSSPVLLIGEIQRELAAMHTTHYQHTTQVDESAGKYFYDCSGLVDYALQRVLPTDGKALPSSTSVRPLAGDIEQYLRGGLNHPIDGWQTLTRIEDLRPGDIVAWLATEDSTTGDTGHVMVVAAAPTRNANRDREWLLPVVDSTLSPHALDSRHSPVTGLGTGTIGLVSDDGGAPIAFYWRGGESKRAKDTEISLGRPL